MGTLLAGAAKTNITPPLGVTLSGSFYPRQANDVYDELHAKAIALSDGATKVAIVVCDLIAMTRDRMDAVKARAEKLCGIPAANIFISCTHTHSGPAPCWVLGVPPENAYMDWACLKIADAVALAARRMRDAQAGAAVGSVPDQVFNRRWWLTDGTVRMNPGLQNPNLVRPAGPTDPDLAILAIETPEREPIALLANYALHYVGAGSGTEICADYFAFFGRAMARMVNADARDPQREFLAIMSNGCSGDINNVNFAQPRHSLTQIPRAKAAQVADVCAAEALRLWRERTQMSRDVTLGVAAKEVSVRKRHIAPDDLQAAKERMAKGKTSDRDTDWFWAWMKVMVSEMPDTFPTRLQALRIGDVGLVGLPGEIFVEIGLQIKARSPFRVTMPIELANGYLGYTCTDKSLKEGSYETQIATSSIPAAGTEALYVETATELFRSLGLTR
ncbi:MAG: hypothetical protein FJ278_15435 [Planctomycetes bacterium]|nr:hypothetical protein [Planctomycetota bacterium]